MRSNYFTYTFNFFFYSAIQVVLIRNMVVFDVAFAFIYPAFILLLPLEIGVNVLMIIAFLNGLVIDIFYDSIGIHTAAMVFIAFIRNWWLTMVTPRGGYEQGSNLTVQDNGLQWYISYVFPLILIHHLLLFLIEAGNLSYSWLILKKTVFSSIFSMVLMVSIQLLQTSGRRRI
jgi:hypothetical protein